MVKRLPEIFIDFQSLKINIFNNHSDKSTKAQKHKSMPPLKYG